MFQETINVLLSYFEICEKANVSEEQTQSTKEAIEGATPKGKANSLKRLGTIESQTNVSFNDSKEQKLLKRKRIYNVLFLGGNIGAV